MSEPLAPTAYMLGRGHTCEKCEHSNTPCEPPTAPSSTARPYFNDPYGEAPSDPAPVALETPAGWPKWNLEKYGYPTFEIESRCPECGSWCTTFVCSVCKADNTTKAMQFRYRPEA